MVALVVTLDSSTVNIVANTTNFETLRNTMDPPGLAVFSGLLGDLFQCMTIATLLRIPLFLFLDCKRYRAKHSLADFKFCSLSCDPLLHCHVRIYFRKIMKALSQRF